MVLPAKAKVVSTGGDQCGLRLTEKELETWGVADGQSEDSGEESLHVKEDELWLPWRGLVDSQEIPTHKK